MNTAKRRRPLVRNSANIFVHCLNYFVLFYLLQNFRAVPSVAVEGVLSITGVNNDDGSSSSTTNILLTEGKEVSDGDSSPNCGALDLDHTVEDSRILHPWIVGIFRKTRDFTHPFKYIVGGTIIGKSTVLSIFGGAYGSSLRTGENGHIKHSQRLPKASEFFVFAGLNSTDIINSDQKIMQIREVEFILPYNDENPNNKEYQLFILHLKTPFDFKSPFVNAICLPSQIVDPNTNKQVEFVTGNPDEQIVFVGGFEYSPKTYNKARMQLMKLGTKGECQRAFRYYYKADASHILCAKPSPGYMDEYCVSHGSGLVFLINTKYYLGGVVALVPSRRLNSCTSNSMFFFSSLTFKEEQKHLVWMRQNVACSPQFSCGNGTCIPLSKLCDHYNDCPGPAVNTFVERSPTSSLSLLSDDEDYLFCELLNYCNSDSSSTDVELNYSCGFKDKCVGRNQLCDGKSDCKSGSDEASEFCSLVNSNRNHTLLSSSNINAINSGSVQSSDLAEADSSAGRDRRRNSVAKCIGLQFSNLQGLVQVCMYNTEVIPCDTAQAGTQVVLSCKPYYRSRFRQSSIRMTCGDDGRWKPFRSFACDAECGRLDEGGPSAYIANGMSVTPQSGFPWYAAIFILHRKTGRYEFSCGASLIENSVIVTAAHCVDEAYSSHKDPSTIEQNYRVVLAAFSSRYELNTAENGALVTGVKQIWIPPTYDRAKLHSDIAILQLTEEIEYTARIRPVCYLSTRTDEAAALPPPGSIGRVSGFGKDENGNISEKLKWASFPIHSTEDCNIALNTVLSGNEFCAGFKNGTNVCEGDSGGGLVFQKNAKSSRPVYALKGIVSRGVSTSDGTCNKQNLAIFTFIDTFSDWICDILENIDT